MISNIMPAPPQTIKKETINMLSSRYAISLSICSAPFRHAASIRCVPPPYAINLLSHLLRICDEYAMHWIFACCGTTVACYESATTPMLSISCRAYNSHYWRSSSSNRGTTILIFASINLLGCFNWAWLRLTCFSFAGLTTHMPL